MLDTANAGKSFFFHPHDNVVTVNSNTVYVVQNFQSTQKAYYHFSIDWCSAHFGCPDGSRFHSTGVAKLYLRCFRSNPTKGEDGVWRTRHSVDVSMGVMAELKLKILDALGRGVRYNLNAYT